MAQHQTDAGAVITEFIHPPIPYRKCDYVAYLEDCGEDGAKGWGETKEDAIENLLRELQTDDPAPEWPPLKCGEVLVFEGGALTINLSGYGSGNGKAELVMDDDDLADCGDDPPNHRKLVIDASEVREIRDFLSRVVK